MNTKERKSNWIVELTTTAALYAFIIWFTMPPEDRRYITLQAMQAYRRYAWAQWLKHTPGWLVEALQVRGKITIDG